MKYNITLLHSDFKEKKERKVISQQIDLKLANSIRKQESELYDKVITEIPKDLSIEITNFNNIIVLTFDNKFNLGSSLIRIEEFSESRLKEFYQRYFTIEKFKEAWKKEFGKGKFTYIEEFEGYNFSGIALLAFAKLFKKTLNNKEQFLITNLFRILGKKNISQFYFIAYRDLSSENATKAKLIQNHELSHALYYIYPKYYESCQRFLETISERKLRKKKEIEQMDYNDSVIESEIIADFLMEYPELLTIFQKHLDQYLSGELVENADRRRKKLNYQEKEQKTMELTQKMIDLTDKMVQIDNKLKQTTSTIWLKRFKNQFNKLLRNRQALNKEVFRLMTLMDLYMKKQVKIPEIEQIKILVDQMQQLWT